MRGATLRCLLTSSFSLVGTLFVFVGGFGVAVMLLAPLYLFRSLFGFFLCLQRLRFSLSSYPLLAIDQFPFLLLWRRFRIRLFVILFRFISSFGDDWCFGTVFLHLFIYLTWLVCHLHV